MSDTARDQIGTAHTCQLIGTDASGVGYFHMPDARTESGAPESLLINFPASQLTNEEILLIWDAAFGSAAERLPCSEPGCDGLHNDAATKMRELRSAGSLALVGLKTAFVANSHITLYGVDANFRPAADGSDVLSYVEDVANHDGYFLAKCGDQHMCFRNPADSGISHSDLTRLLNAAFPPGTNEWSDRQEYVPREPNTHERTFVNDYVSENKVQVYLPPLPPLRAVPGLPSLQALRGLRSFQGSSPS